MRESLTILAILLIVVLTTALVGPYFVNWNAHRGEIERRLSTLVGAEVAVTGPIDVKLLPRPIFRLQDVAVRGPAPQDPAVTAARVDMELSLTALLRGELLFVDADVTAPAVTLHAGADRALVLPHLGASAADRVSLGHAVLRDGTLQVLGPDNTPLFVAGGLSGDATAEALFGPWKFSGQVDTPGGPVTLRVATGALEGGRLRLKAGMDAGAGLPKTDLDGMLTTADAAGRATALGFEGTLSTGGARPVPGTQTEIPWRLTTHLQADGSRVVLSGGELRAGADGRALIATVTGEVPVSAAPTLALVLRARQADLGRLAVSPDETASSRDPAAIPPATSVLSTLRALAVDPDLFAGLPLPLALDYAVDTVQLGGLTFADLAGKVALAAGRPAVGTLSIATPDDSVARVDGRFEPGPAAVFKGQAHVATGHLQRFAASLADDLPEVAAAIRQALPVDSLTADGAVDLSAVGFAARDLVLALDRSRFAGTVTLTRAVGADRARLFADLTSDALDLDALPNWRDTAGAMAGLDVQLTLAARAVRIAAGDTGSLDAGRIALELHKTGSRVTLDRLALSNVGGATADMTGRLDNGRGHLEGRLDANRLGDVARLLDRLVPGTVTDAVLAHADALSPALLAIAADADVAQDGTLTPTLLTLDGTLAGTRTALHLTPGGDAGTAGSPFNLALSLDAPDSGVLLRQLGLTVTPGSAVGRAALKLTAQRNGAGALTGTLVAALGDSRLSGDGRGEAGGRFTGKAALVSGNLAPLARALGLAAPESGAVWPGDATGTLTYAGRRITTEGLGGRLAGVAFRGDLAYALPGQGPANDAAATLPVLTGSMTVDRLPFALLLAPVLGPLPPAKPGALWPDTPFGPALLSLPRSEITLTVPSLPLMGGTVARDAKAVLRLGPSSVTVADLSARLGDGRIGGAVTLHRDGAAVSLSAHPQWSGLPVASPALGGVSQGTLDLAGSGNSAGALVASLGGTGQITVADARLPRLDPVAISRVIAGTDSDPNSIDETAIAQDLGGELDHGALGLGTLTAPVTAAAGVLRPDPVRAVGPLVATDLTGSLDLRTLLLSLKATASLKSLPKDWVGGPPQVSVTWKGPFDNPAREVDAATLVNGIAARAIARDQARIEAFQDDIRERAFFARRLRAIEENEKAARDKAQAEQQQAADKARLQTLIQGVPLPPLAPLPGSAAAPLELRPPAALVPTPPRRPGLPARP